MFCLFETSLKVKLHSKNKNAISCTGTNLTQYLYSFVNSIENITKNCYDKNAPLLVAYLFYKQAEKREICDLGLEIPKNVEGPK